MDLWTNMICPECKKRFTPNPDTRKPQKFCCDKCQRIYNTRRLNIRIKNGTHIPKKRVEVEGLKFNEEDYKQNFKTHCVSCGKKIPGTWESYQIRGNYCSECNVRIKEHWRDNIREIRKLEKELKASLKKEQKYDFKKDVGITT